MRRIVGIGATFAVVVLASGCATRGWVRETLDTRTGPVEQRVTTVETERRQDATRLEQQGQRLERVEGATREGSQRVTEIEGRVQTLGGAVSEASETARRAGTRAEEVDARVTRLWQNRDKRTLSISMAVPFRFDSAELDDRAQTSLLDLVREVRQMPGLLIELEGFSDAQGHADYNVALSARRVEAVRRYLVRNGIDVSRIHAVGLGPVADARTPNAEKRRVNVKVLLLGE